MVNLPRTLLPHHQGLDQSQRARRPRLIGSKQIGHREGTSQRVDLPSAISAGVHAADDGSHAAADDEIGANSQAIEHPEDADVGQTLGAATREDQRRARRGQV